MKVAMSKYLVVERGAVSTVLLDRPEKHNALNQEMIDDLVATLLDLQEDRGVKVVVVGTLAHNFCAGGDLDEFLMSHDADLEDGYEAVEPGMSLFKLAFHLRKPLIVATKGICRGGGVGLSALGHISIAQEGATFALTEVRLGLFPYGIYPLLAKNMGERRALELALTGREFDCDQALTYGLIDEISPNSFERANAIADSIARASLYSLESGVELYNLSMTRYDEGFFKYAGILRAISFKTDALGERVRKFLSRNKS